MVQRQKLIILCSVIFSLFTFGLVSTVEAQAIATFDEDSPPFLLSSFSAPGVVTPSSESLLIDAPSGVDTFGIAGTLNFPPVDFNPNEYQWELRLRVLPGNETSLLDAIYSDQDDGVPVDEGWVFRFDLSSYTPADDWVVLRRGFQSPIVAAEGDGVQNPGLVLIGFVREPANAARLHIELDYLAIVPVPEPALSVLLFGVAVGAPARLRGKPARPAT